VEGSGKVGSLGLSVQQDVHVALIPDYIDRLESIDIQIDDTVILASRPFADGENESVLAVRVRDPGTLPGHIFVEHDQGGLDDGAKPGTPCANPLVFPPHPEPARIAHQGDVLWLEWQDQCSCRYRLLSHLFRVRS
jgi:hypothetical protein